VDSELARIEELSFENCPLQAICIPANVNSIAGSAFIGCKCASVEVDSNNQHFTIEADFLFDQTESRLVRYIGGSKDVFIWSDVLVLGRHCFACLELDAVRFDANSQVTRIEASCFSGSTIKSIVIPRSIQSLGQSCFANHVSHDYGYVSYEGRRCTIESLTFESDSQLTKMEESCFRYCLLKSIVIPRSVEAINENCFQSTQIIQLKFEEGSHLRTASSSCFSNSSITAVCIPRSVTFLDGVPLEGARVYNLRFDSDSEITKASVQAVTKLKQRIEKGLTIEAGTSESVSTFGPVMSTSPRRCRTSGICYTSTHRPSRWSFPI
jgi:hypothetical protein